MIGLFPHCGFLSETSRMLAIYQALRALGEPVCVATHGGTWESLLTKAEVNWTQLGPHMDQQRCTQFVRSLPGIGPPNQSMYSDEEMLAYARAEAQFMKRSNMRLAVTGFTLTTLLSTRLAGIPLAASHAGSYCPPVLEAGLMPAPSRPLLPAFRLLPRSLQRRFMNWSPTHSRIYCAGFNRAAHLLGVEGVPSFAALFLADLTLVTDLPDILGISKETLESWKAPPGGPYRAQTTLRYTGPLFAQLDLPIPARVDDFLARAGDVAYVALTSVPELLVRQVVSAVRRSGCRVLVSSTVHDLADLECAGVLVERLLPSQHIMRHVSVGVVTGGQGSVQTAMACGLPIVGVPLHPEQDLNVSLAQRQGMAIQVAPPGAGGDSMTSAVRVLLDQPSYREQAQHVKRLLGPVDGARSAAEAIRAYLGARVRSAGTPGMPDKQIGAD